MSVYGASNQEIANRLNISRQAVTRHRKKGMPCSSVEDAVAWYQSNVDGSRRRGTFSILPKRVFTPSFNTECDRIIAELEGRDEEPEPVRLDNFPSDFWGESAVGAIIKILGGGSTKPFRKREDVLAVWLCVNAAMRLHLRLMPRMMAGRLAKLRDPEDIEDELMEWSCAFAARWYGKDFEREPILPEHLARLDEFFRALE